MHPNRYFAQTVKNTPALNRYRPRALSPLVARHSRRESGSVRVHPTAKTLAARLWVLFTHPNFWGSIFL